MTNDQRPTRKKSTLAVNLGIIERTLDALPRPIARGVAFDILEPKKLEPETVAAKKTVERALKRLGGADLRMARLWLRDRMLIPPPCKEADPDGKGEDDPNGA